MTGGKHVFKSFQYYKTGSLRDETGSSRTKKLFVVSQMCVLVASRIDSVFFVMKYNMLLSFFIETLQFHLPFSNRTKKAFHFSNADEYRITTLNATINNRRFLCKQTFFCRNLIYINTNFMETGLDCLEKYAGPGGLCGRGGIFKYFLILFHNSCTGMSRHI